MPDNKTIPKDLIRDKIYCVNYLEYLDSAKQPRYCYIAVRQDYMEPFKDAIKRGSFNTDDYGILLESGAGSAPDFIREKMKIMYDCDHTSAVLVSDYSLDEL